MASWLLILAATVFVTAGGFILSRWLLCAYRTFQINREQRQFAKNMRLLEEARTRARYSIQQCTGSYPLPSPRETLNAIANPTGRR